MNEAAAAAAAAIVSGSDVPDNHYDDSSSSSSDGGYPYDDGREASNASRQHRLEDLLNDSDEEEYGDDETGVEKRNKYKIPRKDQLYNPNKDEEDEAYVYKHLRHGMEEIQMASINIRTRKKKSGGGNNDKDDVMKNQQQEREEAISEEKQQAHSVTNTGISSTHTSQQRSAQEQSQVQSQSHVQTIQQQTKILKPRSSDAILSCPCCFQIVCMDCQRHESYSNQFRAMFVMNIDVRWDVHVTADSDQRVRGSASTSTSTHHGGDDNVADQQPIIPKFANVIRPGECGGGESDIYYSVVCANCRTEVAALDMKDEVYHFFGCLASS